MLVVAPWWPAFWDHNFFFERLPVLEEFMNNVFMRGAVSGVGAVTTLAGLAELVGIFAARGQAESSPSPTPNPDR